MTNALMTAQNIGLSMVDEALKARPPKPQRDRLYDQMLTVLESVQTDTDEYGEVTQATLDAVSDVVQSARMAQIRGE